MSGTPTRQSCSLPTELTPVALGWLVPPAENRQRLLRAVMGDLGAYCQPTGTTLTVPSALTVQLMVACRGSIPPWRK